MLLRHSGGWLARAHAAMGVQPPPKDLSAVVPPGYHVYAVGSQECERSITASYVKTSKHKWMECLAAAVGRDYALLRSHALGATHIAVFILKRLLPLVRGASAFLGRAAAHRVLAVPLTGWRVHRLGFSRRRDGHSKQAGKQRCATHARRRRCVTRAS